VPASIRPGAPRIAALPGRHDGNLEIEVPRDRQGNFEPQLVPKGETRFNGVACPRAGEGRTRGTTGSSVATPVA
jgi:Transposase, Mutator family